MIAKRKSVKVFKNYDEGYVSGVVVADRSLDGGTTYDADVQLPSGEIITRSNYAHIKEEVRFEVGHVALRETDTWYYGEVPPSPNEATWVEFSQDDLSPRLSSGYELRKKLWAK